MALKKFKICPQSIQPFLYLKKQNKSNKITKKQTNKNKINKKQLKPTQGSGTLDLIKPLRLGLHILIPIPLRLFETAFKILFRECHDVPHPFSLTSSAVSIFFSFNGDFNFLGSGDPKVIGI